MIISSKAKPRIFPYNGDISPSQMDRIQSMDFNPALNREKIREVGRVGIVDWKAGVPSVSGSIKQMEYGSLELFQFLANLASSEVTVNLTDFTTSQFDFALYKTDDNGTFLGTYFYPKQRLTGFNINMSSPDAFIERDFSTIGEDEHIYSNDNKYVVFLRSVATGAGHQIVFGSGGFATYPDPVADPDESGTKYFIRILRVRSTTTTELVEGTDFTYNSGTTTITIANSQASDVFKVYYTATTYITSADQFTANDSDLAGIVADSCSIYLNVSNYMYRLQSASIGVTFDRQDVKEIGNSEVVARGIRDTNVSVNLGRFVEDYTLEQILRGSASTYGKYDLRKYQDDISLIIKVYDSRDKGTFKLGYKFTNLSPTSFGNTVPTQDYVGRTATLSGQEGFITNSEAALTA